MSKEVDERVVSMEFDNKDFEKNVQTSMNTLDKLKEKLNFKASSKGLENISTYSKSAASGVTGIGTAVDSVKLKFSALDAVAATALANLTNSAVNAGKKVVSAFTIDPVKSGFQEYETQINAIQTIQANTSSKGTTLDQINEALDELNHYADMTIYNFTEMTRNIGTFTAAGVDLDTSVSAIKGIANLAAVSGSTSQQASTAMYQLSQALAAGTVKLQDWNSVVNAGMGGQVFQDALKETARVHGVAIDQMIEDEGSFRETLSEGWLTTEILTETLSKFTGDLTESQLQSMGYTEEQIADIIKMGETANDAATKVKTFTQLVDTLKEAAQSGWTQTWELIVGDFEEAKSFWTGISDTLSDLINTGADMRNEIVGNAMQSSWDKLISKLEDAGVSAEDFGEKVKEVAREQGYDIDQLISDYGSLSAAFQAGALDNNILVQAIKRIAGVFTTTNEAVETTTTSLEHFQELVNGVISGDYGNGQDRINALTEAGEDYAAVQALVNKVWERNGHTWDDCTISAEDLTDAITSMSTSEAESLGYTEEQIQQLKELAEQAEQTGTPINELIETMQKPSGRTLFIESIQNGLSGIAMVISSVRNAWGEIFTSERTSSAIYSLLEHLHTLSEYFKSNEDTADKLKRTLKGLFAIIDIIATFTGGALKTAIKIVSKLLGLVPGDILELTATIGDHLVALRDWVFNNELVVNAVQLLENILSVAISTVVEWFNAFKQSALVQKASTVITDWYNNVTESLSDIDGLKQKVSDFFNAFGDKYPVFKPVISALKSIRNAVAGLFSNATLDNIEELGTRVSNFFSTLVENHPVLQKIIDLFEKFGDACVNVYNSVKSFAQAQGDDLNWSGLLSSLWNAIKTESGKIVGDITEVGQYIIQGLIDGLSTGITTIPAMLGAIAQELLETVKSILGIHSPSTEMEEIGEFTIAGFVNGIKEGAGDVLGAISGVVEQLKTFLGSIDWGKIFAGAMSVGIVFVSKKFLDVADRLVGVAEAVTAPMKGLGSILSNVGKVINSFNDQFKKLTKSLRGMMRAQTFKTTAEGVKELAEAFAIMAGSLIAMTLLMDTDKMWSCVGAMGALAGILVGMVAVVQGLVILSKSGKFGGKTEMFDFAAFTTMLWSLAGTLVIMTKVVKNLGKLSPEQCEQGMSATLILVVGMMSIVAAMGAVSSKLSTVTDSSKFFSVMSTMMLKLAASFAIMAIVIKMLGKMDQDNLATGLDAVAGITTILLGIIGVMALINKGLGSADVGQIGTTILSISGAIAILAIVVKMLASMSAGELAKGEIATAGLAIIVVGMVALLALIGKLLGVNTATVGASILAISASMLILCGVVKLLGNMSEEELTKGLNCIWKFVKIIAAIAAVAMVASRAGGGKLALTILSMAVAVGILAGVAVLLGLLDVGVLAKGIIAVGMFGVIMRLMITATKGASDCKGSIIAMAVAIGVMAAALVVLSYIDYTKLAGAVLALSTVMAVFGAMVKMASNVQSGVGVMIVMVVAVATLAAALAVLANMPWTGLLAAAGSLSAVMLAMSAALLIVSKAGAFATTALIAIGVMTLVVAALAAIFYLLRDLDGKNALAIAASLSLVVLSLSAACVILSAVGTVATAALAGVGVLAILMVALFGIFDLFGAFSSQYENIRNGITIMSEICYGIGTMIGNIIAGFGKAITSVLPSMGEDLSSFMTNLQPFFDGCDQVDEGMVSSVNSLIDMIVALASAKISKSFGDFFGGNMSMEDFTADLLTFGDAVSSFGDKVSNIDASKVSAAADAGTMLGEIMTDISGLSSTDVGSDLENFSSFIAAYGEAIMGFNDTISSGDGIDLEAVRTAAEAGKIIIDMANEIPNSGGILGDIVGNNDLGTFAPWISDFGTAIMDFSNTIGAGEGINLESVQNAAEAGKAIIEMAKEIPNAGGILADMVGDNELGTFAPQLETFGQSMARFALLVQANGGITDDVVTSATNAASILKAVSEASDSIPESGGLLGKIFGENDLGTFSTQLETFGTSMANFATNITANGGITDNALTATETITALVNALPTDSATSAVNLSKFGDELEDFGTSLADFMASMEEISTESISSAFLKISQLYSLFQRYADSSETVAGFNETMKSIGESGVDGFLSAFDSAYDDCSTAGATLATNVVNGITENIEGATTAINDALDTMVSAMNGYYDTFEQCGEYLVEGFANGITAKTYLARAKATLMASQAASAAQRTLDEHSPSKVFYKIGAFAGQGFVNALDDYGDTAYDAGNDMANYATKGLKRSLATIGSIIDGDIETSPTIRPVLDLSSVASGVNALDGMLETNPAINASLSSIGASINRRQNGSTNDDVISAIRDLGNAMSSTGGNTYNVNGITYDDGSNISDAVRSLIRAARVERRV